MRKRIFVVFFSLVFSLTLLIGHNGYVKADSPKVHWNFDSENCSVAINTHTPINFGSVNLEAGGWIYFRDRTDEAGRTVYTESNCTSGYDVYVEAKSYKPNGVDVLDDFRFSTDMVSTRADSAEAIASDWSIFSETGSSVHMGSVTGSDVGSSNFSPGAGNVDGTEWLMDYKYQMDSADTLGSSYQVQLEFTVTSKDSGGSAGGSSGNGEGGNNEGGGEEDNNEDGEEEE